MTTGQQPPTITSTGNKRIVEARKLSQRKYRQAGARFLVEGLQLLHMALDAGATPHEVFFCPEQFAGPEAEALIDRFRLDRRRAAARRAQRDGGAVGARRAAGHRGDLPGSRDSSSPISSLTGRELVLVLDRLQDPGNLGTLIRTADAVGAAAILLIEPCVDPFDPKTLRGSMGSLFNVPVISTKDVAGLFAWLQGRGLRPVGADPHAGELWGEGLWRGGVALVLGNEARGLSPDVAAEVKQNARLPIVGKAESLNVAIAGGVLMYAWLRANLEASANQRMANQRISESANERSLKQGHSLIR